MPTSYLVTGGAGFIGANLVHHLLEKDRTAKVAVYDRLTYAGNLDNLATVAADPRYRFVRGDICDRELFLKTLRETSPDVVYNLAAESHVDRSIDGPGEFVRTNVVGAFEALDASRAYVSQRGDAFRNDFRFVHVSTDEVFGSLGPEGFFTEKSQYAPNSPYAASKAGADHLARAYFHTYGLPVITTNCSNNYGPYQFPEKLIPLTIMNALDGKPLPVYGNGKNVRDWLYVKDHCEALRIAATRGVPGETYNIGGNNERTTLDIVHAICDVLSAKVAKKGQTAFRDLITFVPDRPGHDLRYAIDATKIRSELAFSPATEFELGIERTVTWYLENRAWCERISSGVYQRERLGLSVGSR